MVPSESEAGPRGQERDFRSRGRSRGRSRRARSPCARSSPGTCHRTWFLSDDAFISFRYARNLAERSGPSSGTRTSASRVTRTSRGCLLLAAAACAWGSGPRCSRTCSASLCGAGVLAATLRFAARGRSVASPWPWLVVLTCWRRAAASPRGARAGSRRCSSRCSSSWASRACSVTRPWSGARDPLLCAARLRRRGADAAGGRCSSARLAFALPRARPRARPPHRTRRAHLARPARRARRRTPAFRRHAYYGDWLPNTFHAKVDGLWLEQGWRYLAYFHDC